MFKTVVVVMAMLSLLGCVAWDVAARIRLRDTERLIDTREAELAKLRGIDSEVRVFQQKKGDLQRRIDIINDLKHVQDTTADAVALVASLGRDASAIESVALVDTKKIVVHGRAESQDLIDRLSERFHAKQKRTAPDHSFTLEGQR